MADFASLELSLVDERIMSDFMHTRGLNMSSFSCIMGVNFYAQLVVVLFLDKVPQSDIASLK